MDNTHIYIIGMYKGSSRLGVPRHCTYLNVGGGGGGREWGCNIHTVPIQKRLIYLHFYFKRCIEMSNVRFTEYMISYVMAKLDKSKIS